MRIANSFPGILCVIILSCNNNASHELQEIKKLDHYPSASGIEYLNKQLYLIGDDATELLILDSNLTTRDSIPVYLSSERRLPKDTKPDFEAISTVRSEHRNKLLVVGSGSLSPYRDNALLIDPFRKMVDSIRLDSFYTRLVKMGLKEINIEGLVSIPGAVLFSNRGHKAYPSNFLVVTRPEFWKDPSNAPISLIRMGVNDDPSVFKGVSGLGYSSRSDRLLLAISTENTSSSYEDGAIGKSYLWIVKNISSKREWSAINPDEVIDLESIDTRFKGYKIESVCVTRETRAHMQLVLTADNDDGSSTIFKLTIEKD